MWTHHTKEADGTIVYRKRSRQCTTWIAPVWNQLCKRPSARLYAPGAGGRGAYRSTQNFTMRIADGPEKYDRLVALKNIYDPMNLLRLNQSIKPTSRALESPLFP